MDDILSQAQDLLGPPVRLEAHRGWAVFWCPFHHDEARTGEHGKPNFGVQLEEGYWKCLRCGESGASLAVLRRKLGAYQPPLRRIPRSQRPPTPQTEGLDEAVAEGRAALMSSPAASYLRGSDPAAGQSIADSACSAIGCS